MQETLSAIPDVLDGYHLIRFLGRGGFGEVWLCQSEAMGDYRALKWIPAANADRLEKEYESLLHYRKAAAALRSPALVAIEHVGRTDDGLYYIMPLADGVVDIDPADAGWIPLNLAEKLRRQAEAPGWFSSSEVIDLVTPIIEGLQVLSEAGLVHRDVKPDNILFFHGTPCLGDISLLGNDSATITRRGTLGYVTPSWYLGGHPDMFGAAATLYTILTGNPPDRMGKSSFLWPPGGEPSLAAPERSEWKRLHAVVRRAIEDKVSERYVDFRTMAAAVAGHSLADGVPLWKRTKKRVTAFALLVLAAAALGIVLHNSPQEKITQDPPTEESSPEPPELTPDQKADYQALAGMVLGYLQDGNYANALASVEELLATYPQSRTQSAYSVARARALKGLGRIDEAKEELHKKVNLSPNITAMTTRKDLWEELGDLEEAEIDLTRVLDTFGLATFPLFLRADIRAQRGDFAGVQTDRESAYEVGKGDSEQRRMVETMWTPLEKKYPGYGKHLGNSDEHTAEQDNGNLDQASEDSDIIPLAGKWQIESEVLTSTYEAFAGNLTVIYDVGVTQTADMVLVQGEKTGEVFNGKKAIYEGRARTRIEAQGRIDRSSFPPIVMLDVTEDSTSRVKVKSKFIIQIKDDNSLAGSFSSDAAGTTGTTVWKRVRAK